VADAETSGAVRVAVVDNFGNCKLDRPIAALPGYRVAAGLAVHSARDGRPLQVRCYDRLPDVPYGEPGITTGSSGLGFAELVVRGGSAAELFGLREGDRVLHPTS
jgi:S-adenosylmethionine hydrolase